MQIATPTYKHVYIILLLAAQTSRTSRTKWIHPFFFPLLLMSGLEFTVLAAA